MIGLKEYFKKKDHDTPKKAQQSQSSVDDSDVGEEGFFGDQSWLHRTFDAVSDLVSIHDTQKRCIKANLAAREFLQLESKDMVGRVCHELFNGATRPCPRCPAEAFSTTHEIRSLEAEVQQYGRSYLVSCSPVLSQGEVKGFVRVAKDISRQKLLEKRLVQAQKMESIATLAGGISHDFNNILGAILGNADLMLYRISSASSGCQDKGIESVITLKEIEEHLRAIKTAGNRAKGLINQIQSFSRQTQASKLDVDITPVIKETVKLMRSSLPATIEVRSSFDSDIGLIHADPTQIQQVVMNLCTNAAQAMEKDGGRLDVSLKAVTVGADGRDGEVELQPGRYLRLSVSDTGVGMSEELRTRIFDPFFTTKGPGAGQGMGLAVIHGIVDSHQGIIDVQSEEGKGSCFTIYFPLVELMEEAPEKETLADLVGGSETILLVDDEDAILSMRSKMLQYLGYTILAATNGLDAYALFKKQPDKIDLVITDNTMPLMTGLQLSREISKIRQVPIIFCSGMSDALSEQDAAEAGIRKVFRKPVSINRLARSIREVLNR